MHASLLTDAERLVSYGSAIFYDEIITPTPCQVKLIVKEPLPSPVAPMLLERADPVVLNGHAPQNSHNLLG